MPASAPFVLLNDQLIPAEGAGFFHNRAFLYGDGCFESMRVHAGKIQHARLHESRIRRAMELLELNGPELADLQLLEQRIGRLIAENHHGAYVRVRYTLYRDAQGFYMPDRNKAGFLLTTTPLDGHYTFDERGCTAIIYTRQAKARGPYAGIKSISSQFYVMAGIAAKHAKADDCLVLNTSGHIIEGLSSNAFLWYNKTLITPPLSEGCVDGVLRRKVLDLAEAAGIPTREQRISEAEVMLAEEIILTSTIRGVRFIRTLQGKTFGAAMARRLHELLVAAC